MSEENNNMDRIPDNTSLYKMVIDVTSEEMDSFLYSPAREEFHEKPKNAPLILIHVTPSGKCPVYVVYVYPTNYQENHERWLMSITKDRMYNLSQSNLHNHALPQPNKVSTFVKTAVKAAVQCNPALTPGQVNLGMFK